MGKAVCLLGLLSAACALAIACGSTSEVGDAGKEKDASGERDSKTADAETIPDASLDHAHPMPDAPLDAGRDSGEGGAAQSIAVPMYVDPSMTSEWEQVYDAAPIVKLLVANPDSGPGAKSQVPAYTAAIASAIKAGETIVGYVDTGFTKLSLAEVEGNVDTWYSWYPAIEGIFFDEVTSDPADGMGYYKTLYEYVHMHTGAVVVLNPGTIPDSSYMDASDILVMFEGPYASYADGGYPDANPSWVASYDPFRFWHLVYGAATIGDMQNAVTLARSRSAGYVFVTDEDASGAYQEIVGGGYWTAELTAVSSP